MALSRKTPEGRKKKRIDRQRAGIDRRQEGEVNKLLLKNQTDKQLLVASVVRPALVGLLLLGAPPPAPAQAKEKPKYSDDPYALEEPFSHPHISPRWSKPHKKYPKQPKGVLETEEPEIEEDEDVTEESFEAMKGPEIKIMQAATSHAVEHFLNPSFRLYLEEKGLTDLLKTLKIAIQHFDQLRYTKKGGTIVIKKRPGSKETAVPDDLEIIVKDGKIEKINGKKLDTSKIDDWKTVMEKYKQYRKDKLDFTKEMPAEHKKYYKTVRFNLDDYVIEYLKMVPGLWKNLEDNAKFKALLKRNSSSRKGAVFVRISEKDGRIIIRLSTPVSDNPDENLIPLLNIYPDGRVVIKKGRKYEPLWPENLFAEMYQKKQKGKSIDLPKLPSEEAPPFEGERPPAPTTVPPVKEEPAPIETSEVVTEVSDFDEVTLGNLEAVKSKKLVLVDVNATWCGPCKAYAKTLKKVEKKLKGKVLIVKLTSDTNPEYSRIIGQLTSEPVRVFPTTIILRNGEPDQQFEGGRSKSQLLKILKKKPVEPEEPETEVEEEREEIPEEGKKNPLLEAIRKGPARLVDRILDNPEKLRPLLPKDKEKPTEDLVRFIKDNKDKPWFRKGTDMIKEDIKNGRFKIPTGLSELLAFCENYFPPAIPFIREGVPAPTYARLGMIIKDFF